MMISEVSNFNGSMIVTITSDIFSGSSLTIKEQYVLSQILSHNKSSLKCVKKLRKKYLMNGHEVKNKRQMRCKETQYSVTHYVLQTKKIV